MRLLLLGLIAFIPFSAWADIEFIVTNSEQALSDASQSALSIGSVIVLFVAGLITVTLIISMLRKV